MAAQRTLQMTWTNQLYYGDNLRVLCDDVADESVALVRATRQRRTQGEQSGLF
jgi:hypothetical protein